jgi:hypothetical protein
VVDATASEDDVRPWDVHAFVHVFSEAFGGLVVARDGQVADLLGLGEVAGTMSVVCRFQMLGLLGSEQPIRIKICILGLGICDFHIDADLCSI